MTDKKRIQKFLQKPQKTEREKRRRPRSRHHVWSSVRCSGNSMKTFGPLICTRMTFSLQFPTRSKTRTTNKKAEGAGPPVGPECGAIPADPS